MFGIPLIVVFFIALTFYLNYEDEKKKRWKKAQEENKNSIVFDSLENN